MINVLFSGNSKVFDGILMNLISMTKTCKQPINVMIMTMELTEKNPNYTKISQEQVDKLDSVLKRTNPQSACSAIDMTEIFKQDKDAISIGERFTPYALLRLYATQIDILPDKVLYLDVDTLIHDDISKLYDIDIENYELAGCRDYFGRVFLGFNYINSGVLLLNMKKIRETDLLNRAKTMCINKKMFLADQDAINKCVKLKKILPDKFNHQRRLHKDTVIRHYCTSFRFFPYIHTKKVKQWEIDKLKEDKHNTYRDDYVDEVIETYLKIKGSI